MPVDIKENDAFVLLGAGDVPIKSPIYCYYKLEKVHGVTFCRDNSAPVFNLLFTDQYAVDSLIEHLKLVKKAIEYHSR